MSDASIRFATTSDWPFMRSIHKRQGIDYDLRLEDPAMFLQLVLESEGRLDMALLGRITCETYYLLDPEMPADSSRKWELFKLLHEVGTTAAKKSGLTDLNCWVPPKVEKSFGKRLQGLGWVKPEYVSYTRLL